MLSRVKRLGDQVAGAVIACKLLARESILACLPDDISELLRVANIKSQIKRIRTNEKARQRNKAAKSSLRTAMRKFREAADGGDAATAVPLLREASRALDKAATKGVIHANQAANKKSAMARRAGAL